MSKSDGPKVYDYLMTIHMGWCHGPIDRLNQIWIKDKRVFCGSVSARSNLCIDQPDLFGGDEKEGGVVGVIEYYPGTQDQTSSEEIASRVDRTADRMPGYRGLMHMFFRGQAGLAQGFRWVTNNPYIPATKAHLTRIARQLDTEHAIIWPDGTVDLTDEVGNWTAPIEESEETLIHTLTGTFPVLPHTTTYTRASFLIARAGGDLCDDGMQDAPNNLGSLGDFGLDVLGNLKPDSTGLLPTELEIDSGSMVFRGEYTATFNDGSPTQFGMQLRCYEGTYDEETEVWTKGAQLPDSTFEALSFAPDLSGSFTRTLEATIPAGTRFIEVGGFINNSPFTGSSTVVEQAMTLTWPKVSYSHCAVDEGGLEGMPDQNPAHIIYECMTDDDWGKGEDPIFIDEASFLSCAEVLFDERFGLSIGWFKSDSIESFIQEILDHVKGFLYQHPSTGLWKFRLLRDDYVVEDLPWLTPGNCKVRNPKRQLWGETINEIVVTYTDPNTEEEVTVTRHNMANLAIQGTISSEPRNYYGVRNERLATKLAERDVMESGTPLWVAQIEVDRSFWSVEPGDCFRLQWPEEGIELMVVRVMSFDLGTPKSNKITLNVTEDIFAVDVLTFTDQQTSMHRDPRPMPESPAVSIIMPPPLPEILRAAEDDTDVTDDRYPEVPVYVMVPQTAERGILDVEVRSPVTLEDGSTVAAITSVVPPVLSLLTEVELPAEDLTPIGLSFIQRLGRGRLTSGSLMLLGTAIGDHEIVQLVSYSDVTQYWTVKRGIYDTTPKVWPVGSQMWLFPGEEHVDGTIRQAETEDAFWLLPRTSRGRLNRSLAVRQDIEISARPYMPFRPADCEIDGIGFMPIRYDDEPVPSTLTATWVHRNRWSEDAGTIAWTEAEVAPEAGQTVTLRVVSHTDGSILGEYTGIAANTYDIPTSIFTTEHPVADVQFWAERDGFESLQAHAIQVTILHEGWGEYWGVGWDGDGIDIELPPPAEDPAIIDLTYVPADYTISDSDRRAVQATAGTDIRTWVVTEDPITPGEGRHYWELEFERTAGGDANGYVGVLQEALVADNYDAGVNPVFEGMFGWRGNGTLWTYDAVTANAGQVLTGLPTYGNGDVLMLAFDAESGFLWLGKNGDWFDHPDYASPTYIVPAAFRGVLFRGSIQGRTQGDGATLRGAVGDFNYPLPATCRALKAEVLTNDLIFSGTYSPPDGSDVTLTFLP